MAGSDTPRCPNCGSGEIDVDAARGDAACVDCGTVLEETVIVAEVGFQEDSRGRSSAIGQHVNADGRPSTFGSLPGFSRAATEITMSNGKRRLWHLVSALRMATRHAEAALRLFRLAVERNFHKGRRMANVCCACLYVVCRIEKTPHMLIDFSDVLETNVYVLGHTFLKFAQLLCIELPIIDPSLYIHRFASRLEFGDKTHAVAMSALRLLARMRRDWMSYGRRPAGLCGAALIVAARMHNFYRSQADVVRVVRIGNVALRERLQELDRTPTAALTAAQIDSGGGDDGKEASLSVLGEDAICDPPAFQRLVALKEQKQNEQEQQPQKSGGVQTDAPQSQDSLGQRDPTDSTSDSPSTRSQGATTSPSVNDKNAPATPSLRGVEQRTADEEALEGDIQAALASREFQELELESLVDEQQSIEKARTLGSQESRNTSRNNQGTATQRIIDADKDDGELSDLDDEDVAQYLNTEEEYERKKELWLEMNKEYLEQQKLLEKMKAERPEEYKRLRPSRSSKKRKTTDSDATPNGHGTPSRPNKTAVESTAQSTPPKSSRKLNYAVLESLGRSGGFGATGRPRSATGSARPPRPPRPSTATSQTAGAGSNMQRR